MRFYALLTKPVVAVWKLGHVTPGQVWKLGHVTPGQRLVGLRGKTQNNTLYLFNAAGVRVGWVSADVLDALAFDVDEDTCYIANITAVDVEHQRMSVRLGVLDNPSLPSELAGQLRGASNFPPRTLVEQCQPLQQYLQVTDHYDGMATVLSETQPQPQPKLVNKEEPIMKNASSRLSAVVETNSGAVKQAGYIAAGDILNKQLAKLASAKAPFMVRAYIDTAVGKLVIANLFSIAVRELRPGNAQLQALGDAAVEAAYLEVIRSIDIDGMIDELLSSDTIKCVLTKVDAEGQA